MGGFPGPYNLGKGRGREREREKEREREREKATVDFPTGLALLAITIVLHDYGAPFVSKLYSLCSFINTTMYIYIYIYICWAQCMDLCGQKFRKSHLCVGNPWIPCTCTCQFFNFIF